MLDKITANLREQREAEMALEIIQEKTSESLLKLFYKYGGEKNSRLMDYETVKLLYRTCFMQTAYFNDPNVQQEREEMMMLGYTSVVEEMLAIESEGLYRVQAIAHRDNTDGTEDKTASMRIVKSSQNDKITFQWDISNVKSERTGTAKEGDLRVIIPNIFNQTVRYFFLPKDEWDGDKPWYTSSRSITGKWNPLEPDEMPLTKKDLDLDLRDYEVASFSELAKTPATR